MMGFMFFLWFWVPGAPNKTKEVKKVTSTQLEGQVVASQDRGAYHGDRDVKLRTGLRRGGNSDTAEEHA